MELQEFKIKVLPLRTRLLHYAERLTEGKANAEDAVQEVLLKLWNQREGLERYDSVEALAMTLVHHVCVDEWRKMRPDGRADDDFGAVEEMTPEKWVEIKDEVELVRKIIDGLPPLQRAIIRMKDVEGYETDEIAEILGCQTEAVRSNLSRARRKVRDYYLRVITVKSRRR